MYTHIERARQILTETKGVLSNKDISTIITDESHLDCPVSLVQDQRQKLRLPAAKKGKKTHELKELIKRAKLSKKVATKPAEQPVKQPPPAQETTVPATQTAQTAPTIAAPAAPTWTAAPSETSESALADAIQSHISMMTQDLVQKFGLSHLTLTYDKNEWLDPDIERVVVHRSKIKLKR